MRDKVRDKVRKKRGEKVRERRGEKVWPFKTDSRRTEDEFTRRDAEQLNNHDSGASGSWYPLQARSTRQDQPAKHQLMIL